MRSNSYYILACILFGLSAFSRDKVEVLSDDVKVRTNKTSYGGSEDIIVTIINHLDESLEFYACNGNPFPSYELEKHNGQWSLIDSPICNDYSSFCCGVIRTEESKHDTLNASRWKKGKYRFKYSFSDVNSQAYYSNQFEIE